MARTSSASGLLKRNIRAATESSMGQSAAGVLSTVMLLAASEVPKKNAFQLTDPTSAPPSAGR